MIQDLNRRQIVQPPLSNSLNSGLDIISLHSYQGKTPGLGTMYLLTKKLALFSDGILRESAVNLSIDNKYDVSGVFSFQI